MPSVASFDTITATDAPIELLLNAFVNVSESVGLNDQVTAPVPTYGRNLVSSLSLADDVAVIIIFGRNVVDAISVADGLSAFTIRLDIDDSFAFNDLIFDTDFSLEKILTPSELTWRLDFWTDDGLPCGGLNLKDSRQLDYWINPPIEFLLSGTATNSNVDSISFSDVVNIQVDKSIVDSVTATEANTIVSFAFYANPVDIVILQDQLDQVIKYPGALLVDSIFLPDTFTKEIHINFNDAVSFDDQSAPVVDRGVDSMITMNDVISFNLSNTSPQIVGVEELI